MAKSFHYGGQAVIEGVMIRGKEAIAICVRQPNGELNIFKQPLAKIYKGRLREIPFIRGIFVLVETLILVLRHCFILLKLPQNLKRRRCREGFYGAQ